MWWPNVVTVVIVNYDCQEVCDNSHCVPNCRRETSQNCLTEDFTSFDNYLVLLMYGFVMDI